MVLLTAILACELLITPVLPPDAGSANAGAFAGAETAAIVHVDTQWPRVGDGAWVEVAARVGERGQAGAWRASAAIETPSNELQPVECYRPAPAAGAQNSTPWLAGVSLAVPAYADLGPGNDGSLWAGGPLRPDAAAWDVGDVKLLRRDGTTVELKAALRFGQAAEVTAIRVDMDGNLEIEFLSERDQRVEIATTTRGGEAVTCPAVRGVARLPWWAVPSEGAKVLVRAVRETKAVVPNEGMYRVMGVVEQVLELAPGRVSERWNVQPAPGRPSWEPRKILRWRANFG